MSKETTCSFTGHRYIDPAEVPKLRQRIRDNIKKLYSEGWRNFCCGGALGFDTLAAQSVLEAKKELPEIKLILFLPCPEQNARWEDKSRREYQRILAEADALSYAEDTYSPSCMYKRDRMLAEACSVCIAYLVRSSGGTFYTVKKAKENGVRIINIALDDNALTAEKIKR